MNTSSDILSKITKWCAYQDRSEYEVIQKLKSFNISEKDVPVILQFLKNENYLNEERFVKNYIHSKINSRKWGIEKIKHQLKQKYHIPESLIQQCLQKIDKENYLNKLKEIIIKKKNILEKKETDATLLKKKIINFVLSKGYDISDIYTILKELKI